MMFSRLQIESIENNPDLLNVSIVNGALWLSEDAKGDLKDFTGSCPETEDVREMLTFINAECAKLQHETVSEICEEFNFHGYCVLKAIEHAIETKMHGRDLIGDLRSDQALSEDFMCDAMPKTFVLH